MRKSSPSACALLLCLTISCVTPSGLPAPPAAPASDDRVFFVLQYGGEAVSVEEISRTSDMLAGTISINESLELSYRIELADDAAARGMQWGIRRLDRPPAAPSEVAFQPRASHANDSAGEGAVLPYFDQSVAMVEQMVRHARVTGSGKVEMTVHRLIDQRLLPATVTFADTRFATVEVGGKTWRLALDFDGSVEWGQLTEYGITIERLQSWPSELRPIWPPYGVPEGANYEAVEVRIEVPEGPTLAGTLTLPRASRRVPAAVLITGAAQLNRNQGTPPAIPFRDIADELSSLGIAVLRVDDRGVGESTGDASISTTQDEARDIRGAIAWLRSHPAIDPSRIALIGWSEGGLIAPMIAATDHQIAAIALLNGPHSGIEVSEFQIRYEVERNPAIPVEEKEGTIASMIESQKKHTRSASIIALDTREHASKVRAPVLLLNGTTDRHVPPWGAAAYALAFRQGGNRDVTMRLFPNLSHVLLPDPEGRAGGWPFLSSSRLAPEVRKTLSEWLVRRLVP
jgi:uncharacterized protein